VQDVVGDLYERFMEDEALMEEPTPAIRAFAGELTSRWGEIEDGGDGPWAVGLSSRARLAPYSTCRFSGIGSKRYAKRSRSWPPSTVSTATTHSKTAYVRSRFAPLPRSVLVNARAADESYARIVGCW
jgi:hypothetical protein